MLQFLATKTFSALFVGSHAASHSADAFSGVADRTALSQHPESMPSPQTFENVYEFFGAIGKFRSAVAKIDRETEIRIE
jgi:hypothetical protein